MLIPILLVALILGGAAMAVFGTWFGIVIGLFAATVFGSTGAVVTAIYLANRSDRPPPIRRFDIQRWAPQPSRIQMQAIAVRSSLPPTRYP